VINVDNNILELKQASKFVRPSKKKLELSAKLESQYEI
jgi:hypothetical protein